MKVLPLKHNKRYFKGCLYHQNIQVDKNFDFCFNIIGKIMQEELRQHMFCFKSNTILTSQVRVRLLIKGTVRKRWSFIASLWINQDFSGYLSL